MQYIFGSINPPWSLNDGRHIYKIVEPFILTAVVFLVLASSDLAIGPEFSW